TSIGGFTLGETFYRLSSEILDNQAKGKTRFFKELGAFFVDPVRGLNRQISGRGRDQDANPVDALDWRPPHKTILLALGARTIGEGESISENTKTYPNLELSHTFGSPFDNERRKPFDYFDMTVQFSWNEKQYSSGTEDPGKKKPLNVLRVRGDLASWPLGR